MGSPDASASSWLPSGIAGAVAVLSAVAAYVRSVTRADAKLAEIERRIDAHAAAMTESEHNLGEAISGFRVTVGLAEKGVLENKIWAQETINRNMESLRTLIESSARDVRKEIVLMHETTTRDLRTEISSMRQAIEAKIDKLR